jgi:hypothetical protein
MKNSIKMQASIEGNRHEYPCKSDIITWTLSVNFSLKIETNHPNMDISERAYSIKVSSDHPEKCVQLAAEKFINGAWQRDRSVGQDISKIDRKLGVAIHPFIYSVNIETDGIWADKLLHVINRSTPYRVEVPKSIYFDILKRYTTNIGTTLVVGKHLGGDAKLFYAVVILQGQDFGRPIYAYKLFDKLSDFDLYHQCSTLRINLMEGNYVFDKADGFSLPACYKTPPVTVIRDALTTVPVITCLKIEIPKTKSGVVKSSYVCVDREVKISPTQSCTDSTERNTLTTKNKHMSQTDPEAFLTEAQFCTNMCRLKVAEWRKKFGNFLELPKGSITFKSIEFSTKGATLTYRKKVQVLLSKKTLSMGYTEFVENLTVGDIEVLIVD